MKILMFSKCNITKLVPYVDHTLHVYIRSIIRKSYLLQFVSSHLLIKSISIIICTTDYLFPGDREVDIFFVLSGFIIYYIHSADIGKKEQLKLFLIKRFVRIYPIYWVVLIGMTLVYLLIPNTGKGFELEFDNIVRSIILFPQINHLPTIAVAWTLSYEILFYIFFCIADRC
ncbi:MAG: acyltransferase 3 [Bacilli bacterium]|nr:acyltransferase 3 [Bacilli bacterium]